MSHRFGSLLLVAVVVLAGCGGSEPETPDGYATHDGERAAFAYPKGWKATPGARGSVVLRPSGVAEDAVAPQVELRVFALEDQEFDEFVEQSERVLETLIEPRDGERKDYDADPAGADELAAREVNLTGTDGKPYRTVSVTASRARRSSHCPSAAGPRTSWTSTA